MGSRVFIMLSVEFDEIGDVRYEMCKGRASCYVDWLTLGSGCRFGECRCEGA